MPLPTEAEEPAVMLLSESDPEELPDLPEPDLPLLAFDVVDEPDLELALGVLDVVEAEVLLLPFFLSEVEEELFLEEVDPPELVPELAPEPVNPEMPVLPTPELRTEPEPPDPPEEEPLLPCAPVDPVVDPPVELWPMLSEEEEEAVAPVLPAPVEEPWFLSCCSF